MCSGLKKYAKAFECEDFIVHSIWKEGRTDIKKLLMRGGRLIKILAVDNIRRRLTEMGKIIKAEFSEAAVKSFTDPMLAAQYGVRHSVDVIVADKNTRRIDGLLEPESLRF